MKNSGSQWRKLIRSNSFNREELNIGISATCTIDPIMPIIGGSLLDSDILVRFKNTEFNQIHQTCLDYRATFSLGVEKLDAIIIFWRVEDLFVAEFQEIENPDFLRKTQEKLRELIQVVEFLSEHFDGTVLINDPMFPILGERNLLDLCEGPYLQIFYNKWVAFWNNEFKEHANVVRLNLDAVIRNVGAKSAIDLAKWYLYRQPYSATFWNEAGEYMSRAIFALRRASKKALVLDCDNTLWGGIIGEDLLAGIQLSEDFPGSAYRAFQKQIVALKNRGVFITLLSKNNEEDVWEAFEKHDGMILKREDISAWQINWNSKADNITLVAKALNIETDSLVFIDDNPVEIEEMRMRCPEVVSLQVPEDIAGVTELLKQPYLFEKFIVTQEDQQKTQMAQSELLRKKEQRSLAPEDFLKGLEIKVFLSRMRESEIARVAQLINKTNQFNLTTIRRTQSEVQGLMASDVIDVYTMKVSDKFGDYGLVGVCIVQRIGDEASIDTFLMSCRVLGKGVESAFLSGLLLHQKKYGITAVKGQYIATPKNKLVEDFYQKHGFEMRGDRRFTYSLQEEIKIPEHLEVQMICD